MDSGGLGRAPGYRHSRMRGREFPSGAAAPDTAAAETAAAIAAGAVEVDVVFPYRALLAGDSRAGLELVRRCRDACAEGALLKVILETGQLSAPDNIRRAAEIAIEGGAHFLKTSTGKTQPAATSEAAAVLLEPSRRPVTVAGRSGSRLPAASERSTMPWFISDSTSRSLVREAPRRVISGSARQPCSKNCWPAAAA